MVSILLRTFFLFVLIEIPAYSIFGMQAAKAAFLGFLLSLLNIIFSYASIRWAFGRGTKTFFAVVMGGMASRFIIFAVALFLILRYTKLPLLGFIISFIIFYIFLQYNEVRLINQELKKPKI